MKMSEAPNIWQAVEDMLKNSDIISARVRSGSTRVLGALYDIESGRVTMLGEHPAQKELLGAGKPAHTGH